MLEVKKSKMKQGEIIKKAYDLFGSFEKPLLFTLHGKDDNDPECRDHDENLRDTTCQTLTISQIGPVGYSPVPNFTSQAMAYFLPRLIEFAVRNESDSDGDPYIIRFINSMLGGPDSKQFELLNNEQREIVHKTLLYAKRKYFKVIENECWDDDLNIALNKWNQK